MFLCLFFKHKISKDETNQIKLLIVGFCDASYFDTGNGGKGLLISNFVFKKHYTKHSVHYWASESYILIT